MGLKRIAAGLVVIAAGLALSACSANTGNVAATVGGHVLSETTEQNAATAVTDILGQDPTYAQFDSMAFVLQNDIVGQLLTSGLSDMGITITDAQRDDFWQSNFDPGRVEYQLWMDARTKNCVVGYIDLALVNSMVQSGAIDSNQLVGRMDDISVTVNPRYGVWDSTNWTVSSRASNPGVTTGPLADPQVFTVPA
ncbi:MAG: SurA N-terminal domain-containing protein [Propionibacteriaceae bacterium]|nr:SurA N-terminal domain-containing protein [Propionibacteriaceae bacterium]